MLSQEQLRAVRLLQLRSRRIVQSLMGGQYHSAFKGTGIAFEEVREYSPGDEVRSIDWNVTARLGQAYIKRYTEERELTVLLVLDVSGSMRFGTERMSKQKAVAELAALLATCALTNRDRVGLVTYAEQTLHHLRPAKGLKHVMRILHEVLSPPTPSRSTDLDQVLRQVCHVHRKRAILFLMSDFLQPQLPKSFVLAARQHDLIAVRVQDQRERTWPSVGLVTLQDAESQATVTVDWSNPKTRLQFEAQQAEAAQQMARQIRGAAADLIDIRTDGQHIKALLNFFRLRQHRQRSR